MHLHLHPETELRAHVQEQVPRSGGRHVGARLPPLLSDHLLCWCGIAEADSPRDLGRRAAWTSYARCGSVTPMDGSGHRRRPAPGSSQDSDRPQPSPLPSSAWPRLPLGRCPVPLRTMTPAAPAVDVAPAELGGRGDAHASVRRLADHGAASRASSGGFHLRWPKRPDSPAWTCL